MADPTDATALPPELGLADGDVVEAVEVVVDPVDDAAASPASPTSGFDGIGTRREARERALALLFEAEQRDLVPLALILDGLPVPPEPYVAEVVQGVSADQGDIDERLQRLSTSWPLGRMPAIDRALLRMGSFELARTDVPVGVCISEAVELAKRYSTDESHRFVNGMLASVARELRGHQPD